MRETFAIIYILLIILLGLFGTISRRSSKSVAKPVSYLQFTFIVPIIGNLILVLSENEFLSTIGSYIYFIGMDLMVMCLFDFSLSYCGISWRNHKKKCMILYSILTIDIIQYFFNPFSATPLAWKPSRSTVRFTIGTFPMQGNSVTASSST